MVRKIYKLTWQHIFGSRAYHKKIILIKWDHTLFTNGYISQRVSYNSNQSLRLDYLITFSNSYGSQICTEAYVDHNNNISCYKFFCYKFRVQMWWQFLSNIKCLTWCKQSDGAVVEQAEVQPCHQGSNALGGLIFYPFFFLFFKSICVLHDRWVHVDAMQTKWFSACL